jgi:hypothetical protein
MKHNRGKLTTRIWIEEDTENKIAHYLRWATELDLSFLFVESTDPPMPTQGKLLSCLKTPIALSNRSSSARTLIPRLEYPSCKWSLRKSFSLQLWERCRDNALNSKLWQHRETSLIEGDEFYYCNALISNRNYRLLIHMRGSKLFLARVPLVGDGLLFMPKRLTRIRIIWVPRSKSCRKL